MLISTHLRASKWNRTPESLKDSLTFSKKQAAHVILLTEVADGKRPDALVKWAELNNWGLAQDQSPWQSGEVAALWDKEECTLLGWDLVSIGPDLGPGLPLVAIFAVIEFPEADIIGMFSTTHMPSSVEGDWRARGRRIIEYNKAAIRYRKAASRMRKNYKPDFELLAADWNLNVFLSWVQTWFKTTFPRHKLVIAKGGGTHGPRQIDAALVRYKKRFKKSSTQAEVIPKIHYSSDHKAVEVITNVRQG